MGKVAISSLLIFVYHVAYPFFLVFLVQLNLDIVLPYDRGNKVVFYLSDGIRSRGDSNYGEQSRLKHFIGEQYTERASVVQWKSWVEPLFVDTGGWIMHFVKLCISRILRISGASGASGVSCIFYRG